MILVQPEIKIKKFDGLQIMKNIEEACRTCYRSENLITEDSYKRLLKNCLERGHESILEHEKITTRMICDIGVYKDLTRHRFGSFSIESTRYCNYSKDKYNNNIKFIQPVYYDNDLKKSELWADTMLNIEENYMKMAAIGATSDELRMLLPHSTAAEIVMTCNIREWRHILSLRCSKATHPSIRQLLIPLLLEFKKEMPELFNDIEYDTTFPIEKYAGLSYIS